MNISCKGFGTRWPVAVLLSIMAAATIHAQSFSIDWYKIAGGGGTSTNAQFAISGTIGQPDAGGPMTGGSFSVTGGFWSLINVVQVAGVPTLNVTHLANSITVSWPNTGNAYTLQQNPNLAVPNGWTTSGFPINATNGFNFITITSPVGTLFFRLKSP